MATTLMATAMRRGLGQRSGGAVLLARRGLGDTVRGPPITDLAAQAKLATQFFTKGAISYGEYKAQCCALRLFAFAGVTGGAVVSLFWNPPKSSYWATYGPGGLFSSVKTSFMPDSPPLFLTKKPETDVMAIVDGVLAPKLAAPAKPAAPKKEAPKKEAPKKEAAKKEAPKAAPAPKAEAKKEAPKAAAKAAPKAEAAAAPAAPTNSAFVFVKPHAVTPKANAMVKEGLEAAGLKVTSEGDLSSEEIDEKKLIDQHYYAIASKATILKPKELNIPKDKFKKAFGLEWDDALASGKVFNALDACKEFGCDADALAAGWAESKKADKLVKFGGGFYCGLMKMADKELYVFNAFFMSMRSGFTAPGKSIHYYTVEWDPAKLSWEDFRGKLLGPTDPADAPKDSLRGKMLATWEELGLPGKPNTGDNGVHASASPFEGVAERLNWLGAQCKQDSFCKALVDAGVKEETIKAWSVDPQVKIDADGKKGSLFDALEDMDAKTCIEKCKSLQAMQ